MLEISRIQLEDPESVSCTMASDLGLLHATGLLESYHPQLDGTMAAS